MPAMMGHVPIGRSDDVPPGDSGIVEHAREAVEQGFLSSESLSRERFRVGLGDNVGRDRRGEGEKAALLCHERIERWNRPLVQIFGKLEAE
jgi:hypothetical protein